MPKPQTAEMLRRTVELFGCCGMNCINCPSTPPFVEGTIEIDEAWMQYALEHPDGMSREEFEAKKVSGQSL